MSKTVTKVATTRIVGSPRTPEARLAILRRTAGSISSKRAKEILAFVAKGRGEWDERVKNLPWPKRARKK